MAALGFRTFDEMVGRVDLLDVNASRRSLEAPRPRFLARARRPAGRPPGASLRCTTEAGARLLAVARSGAYREVGQGARKERAGKPVRLHPQLQPHRGRYALGRGIEAVRIEGASRRIRSSANSPGRRARVSARSSRPASPSSSKATPTTTSARDSRAASSSSTRRRPPPSGRRTTSSPAT